MQHTMKIQGRGIGKTKDAVEIALNLLKENPEKNKLDIIAEKKNHGGYISLLTEPRRNPIPLGKGSSQKYGVKVEIVEQTENHLVVKCKK